MSSGFLLFAFILCVCMETSLEFHVPPRAPRTPWHYPCGGEPNLRYQGPPLPPSPLPLLYKNPYQDLVHVRHLVAGTVKLLKKLRTVYVREVFGNHVLHIHSLRQQGAPRLLNKGLRATLRLPLKQKLLVIYQNLIRAAIFVHMVQRDHAAHTNRHTSPSLRQVTEVLGLVEHGGVHGGHVVTGGLYNILCRLRIILGVSGELPEVTDSGINTIMTELSHVTTTAARHNRDFKIIISVQRLLRRVKTILDTIPP